MRWSAGLRFSCSSTTAASRWTTMPPSVHCGRLRSDARTTCSPVPMPAESVPRRSTVCLDRRSSMVSTRKPTWSRCCAASPIIRSTGSGNSCPGTSSRRFPRRSRRRDTQDHLNRNRVHNPGVVDTIQNGRGTAQMTWLPLESKMFTSVWYDADKQVLYLRFRKTGDVYRYFEFPVTEYSAFLGAEEGRVFRDGELEVAIDIAGFAESQVQDLLVGVVPDRREHLR